MKKDWKHLDKYRGHESPFTSPDGATYGAFRIKHNGVYLNVIATDGCEENGEYGQWEHVSIHVFDAFFNKRRIPNWGEMCFIKELFWEDDEVVMQLHPAKKDWISIHDCVLHLWKPKKTEIPVPPKLCV